ncbi:dihydrofolate reductase [Litorihabitans aurantiacus]|uniref:dihydrofolate reductase n=1 Tax=Litorihabitans aurantiacus TaxID=1930061 RepID=A0AA37XF99_9MICO|nr:dihydrofolate reductase [Litorihabitans aurantiacus]GMA32088.1 dihydrofolate reductase [Litorihabitans aurantiacus]
MTEAPDGEHAAHETSRARPGLVGLVWAQTPAGVIAADGELPWDVPEDVAHFRATVHGHPVVMGRATWDSIPPSSRPMPHSRSVVITRDASWSAPGAESVASLEEALALLAGSDEVWVMGGGEVYALAIDAADLLVVSEIEVDEPSGDLTVAPPVDPAGWVETTPLDVAGWRTSRTGTRWRIRHHRRPGGG